jgi:hypothetical protein
MSTNGNGAVPQVSDGLNLVINWNPQTGQVKVSFPQIDHLMVLGMIEFAKVTLLELRAKAEQRVTIPDMQITKRLIT